MTEGGGKKPDLLERIFRLDPAEVGGVRGRLLAWLQVAVMVANDFVADQCLLRASALSFTTILSMVPFFALTFAILKGLGVQNKLEPLILEQVAAGSQEIVSRIVTYINNTNVGSLGTIGLAALVITVITLLGNIEETFNCIWGVRETRPLYRKFSDYLSVVVSAPILLLMAASITTTLQSQGLIRWLIQREVVGDLLLLTFHLVPYVIIWIALIFLYIFIPNTRVRFSSALLGGVLAGTVWQAAQWVYINSQVGVARYNAIYGTLALLPIFMVWIYTSWLIVLFGMEVVYAHQNRATFRRELRRAHFNQEGREKLALALMLECVLQFERGNKPPGTEELAAELDVPVKLVWEVLEELSDAGFLAETTGEHEGWRPDRDPELVTVRELLETLRRHGEHYVSRRSGRREELAGEVIAKALEGSAGALAGMTMKDLALRLKKESPIA